MTTASPNNGASVGGERDATMYPGQFAKLGFLSDDRRTFPLLGCSFRSCFDSGLERGLRVDATSVRVGSDPLNDGIGLCVLSHSLSAHSDMYKRDLQVLGEGKVCLRYVGEGKVLTTES